MNINVTITQDNGDEHTFDLERAQVLDFLARRDTPAADAVTNRFVYGLARYPLNAEVITEPDGLHTGTTDDVQLIGFPDSIEPDLAYDVLLSSGECIQVPEYGLRLV